MGKPNQLTRDQVNTIKEKNNGGLWATEKVTIDAKGTFSKDFKINENDVFLLNFVKL
jgi:xylan 1,4-beta-xylosidase